MLVAASPIARVTKGVRPRRPGGANPEVRMASPLPRRSQRTDRVGQLPAVSGSEAGTARAASTAADMRVEITCATGLATVRPKLDTAYARFGFEAGAARTIGRRQSRGGFARVQPYRLVRASSSWQAMDAMRIRRAACEGIWRLCAPVRCAHVVGSWVSGSLGMAEPPSGHDRGSPRRMKMDIVVRTVLQGRFASRPRCRR
jgi:hypothetical protein